MDSLDRLCKVRVELDLSKNSRLKDLFRQPEFHREMKTYLRRQGLEISDQTTNSKGRVTSIEVAGSADSLRLFIDQYLKLDVPGFVYDVLDVV